MNTHTRQFVAAEAVRQKVPLLVGLMGPSGSGKTFSALRLATGIQSVSGGDIFVIDTEAKRALHYADKFKFKHVEFGAPFGSLDYLDALEWCVKQGAGVVVVDSMSHEHEGPGGMIDMHEQELQRMAGDDWKKRERVQMLAWQKPKANRRRLINGILQLNANFIFCFRAKNTSKPVKNPQTGKQEIVPMGFMPIAGDEFVYEQTLNCLLLPGAQGVPSWGSDNVGERTMIKLPEQFAELRNRGAALDEKVGRKLALWASGADPAPAEKTQSKPSRQWDEDDDTSPSQPSEPPSAGVAQQSVESEATDNAPAETLYDNSTGGEEVPSPAAQALAFEDSLKSAESEAELAATWKANIELVRQLKADEPALFAAVNKAKDERKAALTNADDSLGY